MRDLVLQNAGATGDPDELLRKMQSQKRTTDNFFELQARAQAVFTRSELIRLARALRLWKQEMTRGRK